MTPESRILLVKFTAALAKRLARVPVRGSGFASTFVQAQGEALIDEAALDAGITSVGDEPIVAPAPAPAPEPEVVPPTHKPAAKSRQRKSSK